jgi:hypothetical protein
VREEMECEARAGWNLRTRCATRVQVSWVMFSDSRPITDSYLYRVEDTYEGGWLCKNHMDWFVKKVGLLNMSFDPFGRISDL